MHRPHKFEANFAGVLISDERKKEGSAESVIKFSGIKASNTAADFGCGPGFLTLPLAKKSKTVYAIDINQRMLDILKDRARKERIGNVEPVKSSEYSVRMPEKVDFVFAISLVHEVVRKRKIFEVFHALLKKNGTLVVVDWRKHPKSWAFGPPDRERVCSEEMAENAAGIFKLKKEKILDNQYYLLFEKS